MKSVNIDGIVRLEGETIIAAHGKDVIVRDEATHKLTVKNLSRHKDIVLSYTAYRKRLKLKLTPRQSNNIEFASFGVSGKDIKVGEDLIISLSNNIVDDDNVLPRCPHCAAVLDLDEVGYCPHCGE